MVVNISQSCDHSFLAAFVDTAPNGTSILWLFGTAWRRGTHGQRWSGDCANATTCHLDAFYTHDLEHWWTATNVLVPGAMTYNNNVYRVPEADAERLGYHVLMAFEGSHPPLGPWSTYFAVKRDASPDLGSGWEVLDQREFFLGQHDGGYGENGPGACPTIRWHPGEQLWYVTSGGDKVYLHRGGTLRGGEWEMAPGKASMLQAIIAADPSRDAVQATRFNQGWQPTGWAKLALEAPNHGAQWDVDISDFDVTEWPQPEGQWPLTLAWMDTGDGNNATTGYTPGHPTVFSNLLVWNCSMLSFLSGFYHDGPHCFQKTN